MALVAMDKWYWTRMAGILLDGRRCDLALAQARAAAAAEGTAERWEPAGTRWKLRLSSASLHRKP